MARPSGRGGRDGGPGPWPLADGSPGICSLVSAPRSPASLCSWGTWGPHPHLHHACFPADPGPGGCCLGRPHRPSLGLTPAGSPEVPVMTGTRGPLGSGPGSRRGPPHHGLRLCWGPGVRSDVGADAAAAGEGLSHGRQAVGVERLQPPKAPGRRPHVLLADAPVGHALPPVADALVLRLLQEEGGRLGAGAAAAEGAGLRGPLAEGGSRAERRPVAQHQVPVGVQRWQARVHRKVRLLLVLLRLVFLAAVVLWVEGHSDPRPPRGPGRAPGCPRVIHPCPHLDHGGELEPRRPGLLASLKEGFSHFTPSLVAQLLKNPPVMQETWVGMILWRRERLPTLEFWPGEFRGLYSPWGCEESDMTERLSLISPHSNYGAGAGTKSHLQVGTLRPRGPGFRQPAGGRAGPSLAQGGRAAHVACPAHVASPPVKTQGLAQSLRVGRAGRRGPRAHHCAPPGSCVTSAKALTLSEPLQPRLAGSLGSCH